MNEECEGSHKCCVGVLRERQRASLQGVEVFAILAAESQCIKIWPSSDCDLFEFVLRPQWACNHLGCTQLVTDIPALSVDEGKYQLLVQTPHVCICPRLLL